MRVSTLLCRRMMRMEKWLLGCYLSLMAFVSASGQNHAIPWNKSNPWVDSVLQTLSLDDKIAQLMTIAVWTQRDSNYIRDVESQVRDCRVGGVMFMKGTPHKQAVLTNRFQKMARVPLLVSIDGEWGLSMRLDSTPVFPRQLVLGGANDPNLTEEMGREIAKHCKRLGIHVNFAPDVDVNNNPANPVINDRSFGENKYIVAKHGVAYMKGMQEQHVLATAKHFPGHGDTESDSHHALPVINASRKRLDSLELYPFKELIKNHVGGVMVGHLQVPAIDTSCNTATSISKAAVTGLLKDELGFDGLAVTDGLNMKGVANYAAPGEVAAKALMAGNELLLFVEDVPASISWIKEYLRNGWIQPSVIDQACRKILVAKYWAGLNTLQPVQLQGLYDDLNCCSTDLLIRKVIRKGIVVAKDLDHVIPLEDPTSYKIASVAVGNNLFTEFQQMLSNYVRADFFAIDKNETQARFDSMFNVLQRYSLVVISLHNTSRFVSRKLGLTPMQIAFVNRLLNDRKCILVNHGNPYILQHFQSARNVLLAYEDLPAYNQLAALALTGAFPAQGKMPVSVGPAFPLAGGEETSALERLEYVYPEEAGIDHTPLTYIDTMVNEAIRNKVFPGCQVLAAYKGKVIYSKSFGKQTYDSLSPKIENYHRYDLASLTKMLATTLAVMKLAEEKTIHLTDHIGLYLPVLKGTDKEHIHIRDILLHQAGFPAFIPFYKQAMEEGGWFSNLPNDTFFMRVCDSLWIRPGYEEKMFERIAHAPLKPAGEYLYSDLGFILLRKMVENVTNQSFDAYLNQHFYAPLNLGTMGFNPALKDIPLNRIAPTEFDYDFRNRLVQGYVHDPAAAMLGGVSGHAGLFANANDVAVIMQMLINEGTYGGVRVLKSSTVQYFTRKQEKKSRRGLGFDKPEMTPGKPTPTGINCSSLTFGHTGFTGTCAWADPKNDLVYVFLSNRVYPSTDNNKLAQSNLRTKIHDLLYEAVKKK